MRIALVHDVEFINSEARTGKIGHQVDALEVGRYQVRGWELGGSPS